MSETPIITNIYIWQNGMAMVFDQYGRQLPDYQGPYEQVRDALHRDAPSTAQWHGGNWQSGATWTTDRP